MKIESPGFFDIQVNGFGGIDFNAADLTVDRVHEAIERMRATGVTRCLPTLITSSFDRFARCARVLARANIEAIAGLHMEGPYLSSEDGPRAWRFGISTSRSRRAPVCPSAVHTAPPN